MQVRHRWKNQALFKKVGGCGFLLGNKNGGYFLFNNNGSRYEGLFLHVNGKLHRVVAELGLGKKASELINHFSHVEKIVDGNRENFLLVNGLIYWLKSRDWITISLDVRESYSNPSFGRFYEISDREGCILVEYRVGSDASYIAIQSDAKSYEKIQQWERVHYERDMERNSPPYEKYIYKTIRLNARKVCISFSPDKEKAMREARYLFRNLEGIKRKRKLRLEKILTRKKVKDKEVDIAYKCCLSSLNQLLTPIGVMAGLPWFFQSWSRDELISVKKIKPKKRKEILLHYLEQIGDDGRIPNIDTSTTNADSIGWLFLRLSESLNLFSEDEKEVISERLLYSINRLHEKYLRDGLFYNAPQETWMDTSSRGDTREGFRIEIQCLLLSMYRLASRLSGKGKFSRLEASLRENIRDRFWNGKILADGLEDSTIRPNIFLAAYIYPDLLSNEEWSTCLENSLSRLWLLWGGLSTIDKESTLFSEEHTGEDPRSYHHGDSWYFLNNIAAMVMHKVDREKFGGYIEKILKASTRDILCDGVIGHHSELSSANRQKAGGCYAQAWSASTYLELVDELFS